MAATAAVDEAALAAVRGLMRAARVPGHFDKVYKEECMFCFASNESPGGLFINLSTHQAFDAEHLPLDQQRGGPALYLHQQARKVPLSADELAAAGGQQRPEVMAIGVEGGFQVDAKQYKVEVEEALVVMPEGTRIPLPCPDLPELVLGCIEAVQKHASASQQESVAAWQEERRVSRYAADLEQLPATRRIPMDPKQWRCDETGLQENLWLNLSTGFIGSGRVQAGIVGGGSALRHYEATGRKYPLAVKLGTITPHGADVYSYADDEDDMVLDPQLPAHLAHWGIDVMRMEKSEKSMAELEIDQNLSLEFDKITEAGAALQPLTGPGYVGLVNLGNSCYMNSVLQVLWALPELRSRYVDAAAAIYGSAPQDPSSDFAAQFAKIGTALLTGNTKAPPPAPAPVAAPAAAAAAGEGAAAAGAADGPQPMSCEAEGVETEGGSQAGVQQGQQGSGHSVKPQAFKSLVGRGHPEFSSGRQQDAQEYFGHLLEVASRAEHAAGARLAAAAVQEGSDAVPQAGQASLEGPTARLFKFGTEDRIQCGVTGRVAYISSESTCLGLHIPLEAAENLADLQRYQERQQKRQKVKGEEAEPGAAAAAAVTAATKHEEEEARVVPRVPFSACLAGYAGDSLVEGYYSLAAGKNTQAIKRTRFSSFPPYLLVQLQRYYTDDSWQPRKKEVEVPAPQHLDLEGLRGQGLQPGEQLQPDDGPSATQTATANPSAATPSTTPPPPTADETIVGQLVSMGFTANASRRAALAVGNSNADAATAWACEHMEDPDFNDALPEPAAAEAAGAAGGGGGAAAVAAAQPSIPEPSPDSLAMLAAMGFTERQARGALAACQGSMERAADWLFSREGDLEAAVEAVLGGGGAGGGAGVAGPDAAAAAGPAAGPAAAPLPLLDGPGRYELLGIVSHIGANTGCGHYVAHVKKDGRWAIFDDEKVAASEAPPFDRGYLYLYRRCE